QGRLCETGPDRFDLESVARDAMHVETELTLSPGKRVAIFDPQQMQRWVVSDECRETPLQPPVRPCDRRLGGGDALAAVTHLLIVRARVPGIADEQHDGEAEIGRDFQRPAR